jgi:hypothetical protein
MRVAELNVTLTAYTGGNVTRNSGLRRATIRAAHTKPPKQATTVAKIDLTP